MKKKCSEIGGLVERREFSHIFFFIIRPVLVESSVTVQRTHL